MRPTLNLLAALATVALVTVLSACGDSEPGAAKPVSAGTVTSDPIVAAPMRGEVHQVPSGTTLKLAFITNNSSEFWKIAAKGLEKANKELGINVELKMPETGKVEQQKKIIEDLVSQGYHGFAISLISPADEIRDINKASQTINVITHDSDGPMSKRLAYIGTNNYEAGKSLGKQLLAILPNGGKIAAFVGTLAADNASQRLKGIKDAIAGSKLEVALTKEDNKDSAKARTNVEDVINANPDIVGLVGLWSYNTPAIVAAVKASGKADKLKVAGFDEEDGTLQGISEGVVSCTVVQKPFEFGYRSAVLLYQLCTKGAAALPKDPIIDTGVEVVTKDTVADFIKRLAALKQ
jgi:ribose transport system substrate-binding protein